MRATGLPPEQSLFLSGSPVAGWAVDPMPGDADVRRYWRLHSDAGSAILMDMSMSAPAAFDAFVSIGAHLRDLGLAAPAILHSVPGTQMLLLEDLGPVTLAAAAREAPTSEVDLYRAAVDVLRVVQSAPAPGGLAVLTPQTGADMLAPLFEWYVPRPRGTDDLEAALVDAMAEYAGPPDRLSLRDYFSENLIWRAGRTGTDRIGILDFQDAFLAPAAYDLASLLRDARRDISDTANRAAMSLFADRTGTTVVATEQSVAVLSVQRNLRILGIFARLARRDGKTRYLPMMPRVRAHILRDVAHPALAPLRRPVEAILAESPMT